MKYFKVLLGGIIATSVMTAFMIFAPLLGLPEMNAGAILGSMFGDNIMIGWAEHFLAGIIFAFVYAKFLNHLLPVENNMARGAIYGILLFILSEIVFTGISFLGYLSWNEKESMALMVFGEGLACLLYGTVLSQFVDKREKEIKWRYEPGLRSANGVVRPKPVSVTLNKN